jgi:hypothetical protein
MVISALNENKNGVLATEHTEGVPTQATGKY